jgi:hypothetical protein
MALKTGLNVLTAVAAAVAAQPAAAQREIVTDGPYLHAAARASYPLRVEGFRRSDIYQYDQEGKDVSAGYELATPKGRLLITIYIYPAAPAAAAARASLCDEEFEAAEAAISSQHGNIAPIERGTAIAASDAEPGLAHRSVYRFSAPFGDRVQELRSEVHLYCYVGGDWLVKYRVSAPVGVETRGPVQRFIRLGPWPGRSPESIALLVQGRGTPHRAQR